MADLSRVNDKFATLAQKVDELLAKANNPSEGGGDGGQAIADAIESRIDELLARLP